MRQRLYRIKKGVFQNVPSFRGAHNLFQWLDKWERFLDKLEETGVDPKTLIGDFEVFKETYLERVETERIEK